MKLGSICSAPCFAHAAAFDIPGPGCSSNQLQFEHEDGRRFYAVLLTNHLNLVGVEPSIAIVGLSPAGNQIAKFRQEYDLERNYAKASAKAAFAGLAEGIIDMFDGLGLTAKLGLHFQRRDTFANNRDVFVTSLLACATLDSNGGSDDFDLSGNSGARACALKRFLPQMLSPDLQKMRHVVVLGAKGRSGIRSLIDEDGVSIYDKLQAAGKRVFCLPHPSGNNGEYVKLASLKPEEFPGKEQYLDDMWRAYRIKPPKPGRVKKTEDAYKRKTATVWTAIDTLRVEIAAFRA